MSDRSKQKGKLPDHVVAPEGTSVFRTVNFERYVVSVGIDHPELASVSNVHLLLLRTCFGVETNPVNASCVLRGHGSILGLLCLHGIPERYSTEAETRRAHAQHSILNSSNCHQVTSPGRSLLRGKYWHPFGCTAPMKSHGQQTTLVAAQQELQKLKGSGRQLLEALAETGDNSSRAQKVIIDV